MRRTSLLPAALSAVAALTLACGGGDAPTAPAPEGLTPGEIEALAIVFGAQDAVVLDGFGIPPFNQSLTDTGTGPSRAITIVANFSRSRACPGGGTVVIQGTRTHTWERSQRSASFDFTSTRTENACVVPGEGGATITVDGRPRSVLSAVLEVTDGVPGLGRAAKQGNLSWRKSTGASGACGMDLRETWDPAANVFTLQGTFCGQAVDLTRSWPR